MSPKISSHSFINISTCNATIQDIVEASACLVFESSIAVAMDVQMCPEIAMFIRLNIQTGKGKLTVIVVGSSIHNDSEASGSSIHNKTTEHVSCLTSDKVNNLKLKPRLC